MERKLPLKVREQRRREKIARREHDRLQARLFPQVLARLIQLSPCTFLPRTSAGGGCVWGWVGLEALIPPREQRAAVLTTIEMLLDKKLITRQTTAGGKIQLRLLG